MEVSLLSSLPFLSTSALICDVLDKELITLHFQANETQELEELKKDKEQTEARLNIQISSLNENLAAARAEAQKYQQETKETQEKLEQAEKRNDDLKGETAGECVLVTSEPRYGVCINQTVIDRKLRNPFEKLTFSTVRSQCCYHSTLLLKRRKVL